MKKFLALLLLIIAVLGGIAAMYYGQMPRNVEHTSANSEGFEMQRALQHVQNLSKEAHYVGSENHTVVRDYLVKELESYGLKPEIQEGYSLMEWGNMVKSRNIIAKIKGRMDGKGLMLLSHYDSAPHSYSLGASDDASGIAVILEATRALLEQGKLPNNDIYIVFTDAEELGLNGAGLFAANYPEIDNIGLILNFEARGTSGPGNMLLEVTGGNAAMIKAFAAAKADFPVSNSLMYSIYKMLPNDTDLTVFREHKEIQGFNFAFIDDHFNYHTVQDDYAHLNKPTLAHQATYIISLLKHFGNSDLTQLKSEDDRNYFNTPLYFFHYDFQWNWIIWIVAAVAFVGLYFLGIGKRLFEPRDLLISFFKTLLVVILTGLIAFLGWKFLGWVYPQYGEILHGFTYNGHDYIWAFIFLTIAICLFFYSRVQKEANYYQASFGPLLVWLILTAICNFALPGAAYLIWPVFFTLISIGYFVLKQNSPVFWNALIPIAGLFIYGPFIYMLPIGLGLKMLAGTAILLTLMLLLLLPSLQLLPKKWIWASASLIASVYFFSSAHIHSNFEEGTARPSSLNYLHDIDKNQAHFVSYNKQVDDWSKLYLSEDPQDATPLRDLPLFSKYNSGFNFMHPTEIRNIPQPAIYRSQDTVIGAHRHIRLHIEPRRKVNRYDVFATATTEIIDLKANFTTNMEQKGNVYPRRKGDKKILSYYVVDNDPLVLEFKIDKDAPLQMEVLESSFDLLQHPAFRLQPRPKNMMPMPFVLTDAVSLRKRISFKSAVSQTPEYYLKAIAPPVSDTISTDQERVIFIDSLTTSGETLPTF